MVAVWRPRDAWHSKDAYVVSCGAAAALQGVLGFLLIISCPLPRKYQTALPVFVGIEGLDR